MLAIERDLVQILIYSSQAFHRAGQWPQSPNGGNQIFETISFAWNLEQKLESQKRAKYAEQKIV